MIKVLEGNEFFINEYLENHIALKFKGLNDFQKKYSIVYNPSSINVITQQSAFAGNDKVIIWDYEVFKDLESFNPYVIPTGVDIFITAKKIDKRLNVIKNLEVYGTEFKLFKDLYPNQIENWILDRKKKLDLQIQPDAIKLLAVMYGTNIQELANFLDELKKLKTIITKAIVNKNGVTVNVFNVFELQDEVLSGRIQKSQYILRQLLKSGEPPMSILRYFINLFIGRLFPIVMNDEEAIKKLKLHDFIIKKLKDLHITDKQCVKALEFLRQAEARIMNGYHADYTVQRTMFNLGKLKTKEMYV